MTLFKGFHLEWKEQDGSTTRPCMGDFDAVALPIFHSRLEAWKFLRGWSKGLGPEFKGLTTQQLRRKGYRCVPVKVEAEDQSKLKMAHKLLGDIYLNEIGWTTRLKAYMDKYGQ